MKYQLGVNAAMINGTWQHLLMGVASTLVSFLMFQHAYEAIVMMVVVEAVQWDALGIAGRVWDTIIDLLADAVGGLFGYVIFINLFL